ncbi:hypothetical protein ABW20_dc0108481 [Dactylellina cionopaga]|nr:hypothetical protein ABW20_dc0108481 [Dactylellina cionopaga]
MPYGQEREADEGLSVLQPLTMNGNKPAHVEVVSQMGGSEVVGDLLDIQNSSETIAVQHHHTQSDGSLNRYDGSRLFIPPPYQGSMVESMGNVTELEGEENPEPFQMPPAQVPPPNLFVMPPKPMPWTSSRKLGVMSPSASEFRPIGALGSSALPIENPIFQIKQATGKRSMAIPIVKPEVRPARETSAPELDMQDSRPNHKAEEHQADDGWGDKVVEGPVEEPAIEGEAEQGPELEPEAEREWDGAASLGSLPEKNLAQETNQPEHSSQPVAPSDTGEVDSISETVVGPGPKYENLSTNSDIENQNRGDEVPPGDTNSLNADPESKYEEWAPKRHEPALVEAPKPAKPVWTLAPPQPIAPNPISSQKPGWAAVASFSPAVIMPTSLPAKPPVPLPPKIPAPMDRERIVIKHPNGQPITMPQKTSSHSANSSQSERPTSRHQKQPSISNDRYVHFVPPPNCAQQNPKAYKVSLGLLTPIRKMVHLYAKNYKDSRLLIAISSPQNPIFELGVSKTEDGMVTTYMVDADKKLKECDFGSNEFWVSITYTAPQRSAKKS